MNELSRADLMFLDCRTLLSEGTEEGAVEVFELSSGNKGVRVYYDYILGMDFDSILPAEFDKWKYIRSASENLIRVRENHPAFRGKNALGYFIDKRIIGRHAHKGKFGIKDPAGSLISRVHIFIIDKNPSTGSNCLLSIPSFFKIKNTIINKTKFISLPIDSFSISSAHDNPYNFFLHANRLTEGATILLTGYMHPTYASQMIVNLNELFSGRDFEEENTKRGNIIIDSIY